MAMSASLELKATLNLRGSNWLRGLRNQKRANAAAYGVGSKGSSAFTPAHGSPVTLRTTLPQASRVETPDLPNIRRDSAALASGMWWIWMFWRVVIWPLRSGAKRSVTSAKASIWSAVTPPIGSLQRSICTPG